MVIDRDAFVRLAQRPRQVRAVAAPELGGEIFIRTLTGEERERLENAARLDEEKESPTQRARVVQATVCDEAGNLMFPIESDIRFINTLPWTLLKRIAAEANSFNGLTAEAYAEAEKKSTSPPPAASSTGSPGGSASPSTSLLSGSPPPT